VFFLLPREILYLKGSKEKISPCRLKIQGEENPNFFSLSKLQEKKVLLVI